MSAHARLSPSAAERWMPCPGSVRATEHLPDSTSVFAAEGSCAHWVREWSLILGCSPFDFVGQSMTFDGFEFTVDETMASHLMDGLDRIEELGGMQFVEHRCDLSRWMPGQFGTLDTGIVTDGAIYIDDLKYGQGEEVEPEKNKQLMIYALGFWDNIARHHTDATDFVISIDQPRAGGIKVWETTLDELLAFGEEVREAAKRTYDKDAPFCATRKGCRWCLKKELPPAPGDLTGCRTYDEFMAGFFADQFEDLDGPLILPANLTALRRANVVLHADLIRKWLARLHEDSQQAAEMGCPDPGLKLAEGKAGARFWTNETRAERILRIVLSDDAYTRKLKSPTQADKDVRPRRGKPGHERAWNLLNRLIDQPKGKPILVPEDSPKPAIQPAADVFDDLP